jgi:hypothetical protein
MPKLIIGKQEYFAVSSAAFFESEYEALVMNKAELLFPDYHIVPFKPTVQAELGRAKPDLALIDKRYRKWWVVEVELSHHPLGGHVLPQIAVLATAEYGADIARYLGLQSSNLDQVSLNEMMKGMQPQVLVIVNKVMPDWIQPLSLYGALVAVVEVFRSEKNEHALRLDGDYPEVPTNWISSLRFDPHIPRMMIVDSPAALAAPEGRLEIVFEREVTEWTKIATKDRVWLSPVKSNPLEIGSRYALSQGDDGRFRFVKTRHRRRI